VSQFTIDWRDSGFEPECAPNPDYPEGIDLDVTRGAMLRCRAPLPYPAKRVGVYTVRCTICGFQTGCTTAGRADDPRSITLPCRVAGRA
jgi:hypothetical protein